MAQLAASPVAELVQHDPWFALLAFRHLVATVPGAEAVAVRDHRWGLEVWTIVHRSTPDSRQALANRQWELMSSYPELDVDFHIVDRQDTPLSSFLLPCEYDLFIRLRPS